MIARIEFDDDPSVPTVQASDGTRIDDVGAHGEETASSPWRRRLALLVPAFFVARVLATDISGVVTNDSLGYFTRAATDPFGEGLVAQGYRQVAQPLWIVLTDAIGTIAGWDRVFGVAILQRSILIAGVVLVWWALRLWAVPVLLVVTTPTYVVHADFVLPEGFLIPWCVVAAGLTAAVMVRTDLSRRYPSAVVAASGALAFVLSSIKLQYTSLLCLTAAIAWVLFREGRISRRLALGALMIPFMLSGTLAVAQAFENRAELGVFEPVSERARAEWYGAWQAIFVVDEQNAADPALAEYYAEGNLYTFLHGLEASEPDYEVREEILGARVDSMFADAGTTRARESVKAFIGGLQAGRTDDLNGTVNRALAATPTDQSGRLTANFLGKEGGESAVLSAVNESRPSGVLSSSVVFRRFGRVFEDYRPSKGILAMISVGILALSLVVRGPHRPSSMAALALIGSVSAALGSAYIDNARYLLGPTTIVFVLATVAVRSVYLTARSSP